MEKQTLDASMEAKREVNMQGYTDSNFIFDQCQSSLSQFIAMQHEQQRTAQKFIGIQEKMLDAVLYGTANISPENFTVKPAPPSAETPPLSAKTEKEDVQPIFVTQGVPPTPNLPKLEVERPQNEYAAAQPVEASMPSPEKTAESVRPTDEQAATTVAETAAPAVHPSTGGIPSTEEFKDGLLQIASERTGFPTDMLDVDLNMEADLGIDSIKKVEIFSMLQDKYSVIESLDQEKLIEELAGLSTLGNIIDWYDDKRKEFAAGASPAAETSVSSSELTESVA